MYSLEDLKQTKLKHGCFDNLNDEFFKHEDLESDRYSFSIDQFKQTFLYEHVLEILGLTENELYQVIHSTSDDLHDPFLLSDASTYIERLKGYLDDQKVITIIPDYDADGVLSGVILNTALDLMGFNTVHLYTPRVQTGFGITKISASESLELFPDTDVIMTTDNGSSGFLGVNYLLERGIDVLISDHHQALEVDPTVVSVNPNKAGDDYPFGGISGGVVIWKLMCLFAQAYAPFLYNDMYDLIALAGCSLVTDVMPMVDENRFIVKEAIRLFNDDERLNELSEKQGVMGQVFAGLKALIKVARDEGKLIGEIDTATFGFVFGPMFNTPRRLDGASYPGFKLFLEDNPPYWAKELFRLNEHRKILLQDDRVAFFEAMRGNLNHPMDAMVSCMPVRQGFVGLIAGEFTQKYDLPSIVFRSTYSNLPQFGALDHPPHGITISGSGRAPEWFHLHRTLLSIEHEHPEYFKSWGGHQQACGISIYAEHYSEFRRLFIQKVIEAFKAYQELVKANDYQKKYIELSKNGSQSTISTDDDEILLDLIYFLKQLEPFGNGFPAPLVRLVLNYGEFFVRYIGSTKQHVKIDVSGFDVLYWNGADEARQFNFNRDSKLEVIGRLDINRFRGEESPQLIVESMIVF